MEKQRMRDLPLRPAPRGYDPIAVQSQLQRRILARFPDAPVLAEEGESVADATVVAYLNVQAAIIELCEALDHLPFKWWKAYEDEDVTLAEYDGAHDGAITEAKYELVDALHFIANAAIALGMDWQELLDVWHTKQALNFERQDRRY